MRRLSFLILLALLPLAGEETSALYLTWKESPSTTMVVRWLSKESGERDFHYQRQGEENWHQAAAFSRPLPGLEGYHILSVELKGLIPESRYSFRLGQEKRSYQFRTLPEKLKEPLSFVDGGDFYHDKLEVLRTTCHQAASWSPRFALLGGDIAYSFLSSSQKEEDMKRWIDFLQVWQEEMVTPEGDMIPMVAVIGNHETRGWYGGSPKDAPGFYALFPLPEGRSWRCLDFGDYLSLFLLDSDHTAPIDGKQREWLESALRARASFPHKLACYHVAAFPSRRLPSKRVPKRIRKHWVPLFEKYGVQAALEHHDHRYKRTFPIRGAKRDRRGVTYFGDGGWGVKPSTTPAKRANRWYLERVANRRYFLFITLQGDKQLYQAVTPDGVVFDAVQIDK